MTNVHSRSTSCVQKHSGAHCSPVRPPNCSPMNSHMEDRYGLYRFLLIVQQHTHVGPSLQEFCYTRQRSYTAEQTQNTGATLWHRFIKMKGKNERKQIRRNKHSIEHTYSSKPVTRRVCCYQSNHPPTSAASITGVWPLLFSQFTLALYWSRSSRMVTCDLEMSSWQDISDCKVEKTLAVTITFPKQRINQAPSRFDARQLEI